MKLIDFTKDVDLNALRAKIAAELGEFDSSLESTVLTLEEIELLVSVGIDVDPQEIDVLEDSTLAYKSQRVILHIRDVQGSKLYKTELPKYHIAMCSTQREMLKAGRSKRYVVANQSDALFCFVLPGEPSYCIASAKIGQASESCKQEQGAISVDEL